MAARAGINWQADVFGAGALAEVEADAIVVIGRLLRAGRFLILRGEWQSSGEQQKEERGVQRAVKHFHHVLRVRPIIHTRSRARMFHRDTEQGRSAPRSSVSEWYERNIAVNYRISHSGGGGNTAMRAAASLLVAGLFCAGAVQGQQQSVTLQMQCRNLSGTGNYMAADESYVNGMACRPVSSGAASSASAAEPVTVAQNQAFAAAPTYAYASAPVLGSGSMRTAVAS